MKWNDSEYREITSKIIKAFYKIHNKLGPGFLEKAYHNALFIELSKELKVNSEKELEFKRFDNFYQIEKDGLNL